MGNEGGLRGQVLTILPLWPLGAFEMQVIRVQSWCLSLTSQILVAKHTLHKTLLHSSSHYYGRRRKDGPRPPLGWPHISEEEKRNKSLHCSHFWQHTPLAVFRQKDSSELPPVGLFNHDLPFLGLFGNVQWLSGRGFICTITCMHIPFRYWKKRMIFKGGGHPCFYSLKILLRWSTFLKRTIL